MKYAEDNHKRIVRRRRKTNDGQKWMRFAIIICYLFLFVTIIWTAFSLIGYFFQSFQPFSSLYTPNPNYMTQTMLVTDLENSGTGIMGELIPPPLFNNGAACAFSAFSFYIEANSQAYADFYARRPELDAETVVWKVNVMLHLPFYSEIHIDNSHNPLLLSPFFRLPYGFSPSTLVSVYSGNPSLMATAETAEAFQQLRASSRRAGFDLAVVSAYRNATHQQTIFGRQENPYIFPASIARPYHSEHQTGRALDLWGPINGLMDSDGVPSPVGLWVKENVHYYGFLVRYTAENSHITGFISEPWHITYVSREIAMYMHINNISSLEEYVGRNPHLLPLEPV